MAENETAQEKAAKSAVTARRKFFKKIVDIQSRLIAKKSKYNEFGRFHYRSLEDINEAVKPLLAEHGLAMVKSDEIVIVGDHYYVKATVTITDGFHEWTNTASARETEERPKFDGAQLTGAASTYARKYALGGLLAIADNDGADALPPDDSPPTSKRSKITQPQQAPPKQVFEFDSTVEDPEGKITESRQAALQKIIMPLEDSDLEAFNNWASGICKCEVYHVRDVNNGGYDSVVRGAKAKVEKTRNQ